MNPVETFIRSAWRPHDIMARFSNVRPNTEEMCYLVLKTLELRGPEMATSIMRFMIDVNDCLWLYVKSEYFNKFVDLL